MKTVTLIDRGSAAYALAVGVPLVRVVPGSWQTFEFDDTEGQASAALRQWRAGTGLVNARAYWAAFKTLREASSITQTTIGDENNGNSCNRAS